MIKNKRNKRIRVLSIITLAAMLATTFSLNQSFIAFANEKTEEYTVIVENNDGLQKLRDDYSVSEDNAPLKVDGEFAVTAELTDRQVNKLSENEDIKCIEKDFEINAPGKYIDETVKPIEYTWGLEAGNIPENTRSNTKIKVALLDSGIDCTDNIIVKERQNFILDDPVSTPVFEDTCGHGTSVASMICGIGVESNVKGTNPNIELYSAKVLDADRQAPVSRVVSAIYWAIDKGVDIINISFGTDTYSEALEIAINDAEKAGIIVVAATGNTGTGNIDYPAAFDNTIAVGSVNAKGEMSEFTSRGAALDVLAPGEAVLAQCNFGEDLVLSGTSLSAGYMTGVISLLIDRDKNISVDFVKTLIKESSKKLSNAPNADYGIVDYGYAASIYDRVEKELEEGLVETEEEKDIAHTDGTIESSLAENTDTFVDLSETTVNGSWSKDNHSAGITNANLKKGARYPDEHTWIKGMRDHPEFHGFSWRQNTEHYGMIGYGLVNYVANYRYLVKIANAYGNGHGYTYVNRSEIDGLSETSFNNIRTVMQDILDSSNNPISGKSDSVQRSFVMGMALHTATDAFAHSTFYKPNSSWVRITHEPVNLADDTTFIGTRFLMAKEVKDNIIARHSKEKTDFIGNDFYCNNFLYQTSLEFRLNKLKSFAQSAGVTNTTILNNFDKID